MTSPAPTNFMVTDSQSPDPRQKPPWACSIRPPRSARTCAPSSFMAALYSRTCVQRQIPRYVPREPVSTLLGSWPPSSGKLDSSKSPVDSGRSSTPSHKPPMGPTAAGATQQLRPGLANCLSVHASDPEAWNSRPLHLNAVRAFRRLAPHGRRRLASFVWGSDIFTADEVRAEFQAEGLQFVGSRTSYIGCSTALAQLMLVHCSWTLFILPSSSDNASANSGVNRLLTEPLSTFWRLSATWVRPHRVQFQAEHMCGEQNNWADALSHGRLGFIQHCYAERVGINLARLASASHAVSPVGWLSSVSRGGGLGTELV